MSLILVTGGAGFIGSHVAEALAQSGHRVVVLHNLSGGCEANAPAGAELIRGNVSDVALVARAFTNNRFEYVFHFAEFAAGRLSHFVRQFTYSTNALGPRHSSMKASGSGAADSCSHCRSRYMGHPRAPHLLTKRLVLALDDPYGISKYASELDLAAAGQIFGLPHTTCTGRARILVTATAAWWESSCVRRFVTNR